MKVNSFSKTANFLIIILKILRKRIALTDYNNELTESVNVYIIAFIS